MGSIQKIIEKEKDLTSLVVTGKVSFGEVVDAIKDFYESEFTMKLLWDFSECDLSEATRDRIQVILSVAKEYAERRRGGKSAIVFADDFGFGMGRMYEILSEVDNLAVPQRVFKSKSDAMDWLNK